MGNKQIKIIELAAGILLLLFLSGCAQQQTSNIESVKDDTYGIGKDLSSADKLENMAATIDLEELGSDLDSISDSI